MQRSSLLAKAASGVRAFLTGPTAKEIEPRKGTNQGMPYRRRQHLTDGTLVKEQPSLLPIAQYAYLADRDDIIWAIRQTLRRAIGELEWRIVPDIKAVKADLKRWQAITELNLAMPGVGLDFAPQSVSMEFFVKASGALRDLLRDEHAENGDDLENNARIRAFFENCVAYHNVIAEGHVGRVQRLFESPNAEDLSFRTFIDQVVDQLTLTDAAPIVKNPLVDGSGLGEMYLLPGTEVRLYRCKDRSIPQPPNVAYDWSTSDRILAYYNNIELLYMVANPQMSGYGKSPLDVLFEQMMASLYGDAYLLDFFANNNMPRGVFDLGPNIEEGERGAIEEEWNNKIRQGLRRVMFVSNAEGVKGWIPIPQDSNKDLEIVELQKHWANRKCAAYGLSLNDIGFTEDLHRTTSETQHELTQSRGINSLATIIESKFNGEIVRGFMWCRDNPHDPTSTAGRGVPIFPFRDVKFEFIKDTVDEEETHESDIQYLQNGVLSINEIRRKLDEPPIVGGDTHFVSSGGTPIKVADLPHLPEPTADAKGDAPHGAAPNARPDPLARQNGDGMEKRAGDLATQLAAIIDP